MYPTAIQEDYYFIKAENVLKLEFESQCVEIFNLFPQIGNLLTACCRKMLLYVGSARSAVTGSIHCVALVHYSCTCYVSPLLKRRRKKGVMFSLPENECIFCNSVKIKRDEDKRHRTQSTLFLRVHRC